jgi:hypothetical protein
MFVDVEFGGVEASTSWGSYATDRPRVVDRFFWGEILVGLPDTDATFGWHHSFLEGVMATLHPLLSVCRVKP